MRSTALVSQSRPFKHLFFIRASATNAGEIKVNFHKMAPNKILSNFWLLILMGLYFPVASNGKNVLFFFGMSTYSHRITAWPLAVKLAEEGHSVTFLQVAKNKQPHPKITDVIPEGVEHVIPPDFVDLRIKYGRTVVYVMTHFLPLLGADMCDQFLNNTNNIDWINANNFDLVVIDALFNDCAYGLAWKWNAKTVVFGTTHVFEWFPDTFGFSDESASIASIHFGTDLPLGFFGRVRSALAHLYFYFSKEFRFIPRVERVLREKLKMPDMPELTDLIKNTSLVFLNTHFSEELPRALPPNVIPIGGMHVSDKVKPLPAEMEKFIERDFIYVSFGSEADISKSNSHVRDILFTAMRKSKGKFLWRWIGERPTDMPDNVYTSSWMPQQNILGHPKCRGFITHGGLLSMQEAVSHAVPMIVFPIFAEQDYNAERLHRTGRGIRLELGTLTQEELDGAINRLLTDSSMREQMKQTSVRFKDRQEKPVDTALWWVNYILRHEDTSFLRPHAISLSWFQRRQLDVWAFIMTSSLLFLYCTGKLLKKLVGLCFGRKSVVSVSQGKKRN